MRSSRCHLSGQTNLKAGWRRPPASTTTNNKEETTMKNLTNDDTRDITIRIMEHLIEKLAWDKTDQQESEWYPFALQDEVHGIINEALNVKE